MTNPIGSDATQNAQKLAQNIAKQIANAPFEIGKAAVSQVMGTENPENKPQEQTSQTYEGGTGKPIEEQQKEEAMNRKDASTITALQNEMKEIRERKETAEVQRNSIEKRQKEAEKQTKEPFVEADSKRSRNIFFNIRQRPKKTGQLQAERQKVHVEKPMTTSGG